MVSHKTLSATHHDLLRQILGKHSSENYLFNLVLLYYRFFERSNLPGREARSKIRMDSALRRALSSKCNN